MTFSGEISDLTMLLNDLTEELDKFTFRRNTQSIKRIVNTSFDVDIMTMVKLLLTIRKINNENLLEKGDRAAKVYLNYINKLILSKNNVEDADSHPVGQDLSIFSCASKSQSALNVKRLKINTDRLQQQKGNVSPFIHHITETLGFKNDFIEPPVNDSSMHSNPIVWFRVVLNCNQEDCDGSLLSVFKKFYRTSVLIQQHLHDIHLVSEEFNIIELYYKKNAKKPQLLFHFQESEFISSIIFCSELGLLKKMKIRPCDVLSNMLKFYFCMKTKNLNFSVTGQKDLQIFHHIFLMCAVLMYPIQPAPLSAISYSKPMFKSLNNAKKVEKMTGYEFKYMEVNGPESIINTSATIETIKDNKRHCLHATVQDRDNRILNGLSTIGGANISELVVESEDSVINERIELLQNLSKKT